MTLKIKAELLCEINKKYPGEIILDPEDYERFKLHKVSKTALGYINIYIKGELKLMQQAVTDFKFAMVDHKNGIPWDCRKENLRECTTAQNQQNTGTSIRNTSGQKGVRWDKHAKKWKVQFNHNGKTIRVGDFKDYDFAVMMYRNSVSKYHKEFTKLE